MRRRFLLVAIGLMAAVFVLASCHSHDAASVPSQQVVTTVNLQGTGQTATYATGDDGDLREGAAWPNPRFTAGTGTEDNCVRDNLTGLMWVKSPDSTKRTWPDALTYANGLSLCGYDDWRLPNRKEFWSLIDRSKARPPISDGHPFTNVQADSYWSSTSFSFDNPSDNAWYFNLSDGSPSSGSSKVGTSFYVWPVRSAQIGAVGLPKTGQTVMFATGDDGDLEKGVTWPSPRFIAGTGSEEACVTDNLTGLMWVKSPDSSTKRTWPDALTYANGLSLCGFDDWRLPNINELESVTNQGEPCTSDWLNNQGFGNLVSAFAIYWSSTTYADNTDLAWRVGLCSGNAAGQAKTETQYVWPVRTK